MDVWLKSLSADRDYAGISLINADGSLIYSTDNELLGAIAQKSVFKGVVTQSGGRHELVMKDFTAPSPERPGRAIFAVAVADGFDPSKRGGTGVLEASVGLLDGNPDVFSASLSRARDQHHAQSNSLALSPVVAATAPHRFCGNPMNVWPAPSARVICRSRGSVCVNVSGLGITSRPRWRFAQSGPHNHTGLDRPFNGSGFQAAVRLSGHLLLTARRFARPSISIR